jgi:hypothetical protein
MGNQGADHGEGQGDSGTWNSEGLKEPWAWSRLTRGGASAHRDGGSSVSVQTEELEPAFLSLMKVWTVRECDGAGRLG